MKDIDLLCLGRAAVDLYAEQIGTTLEKASSFAKYVGGCPANIAIGTSRLSLKSAMLTSVGNEAMGRYVVETLREENVITDYITTKEKLTGLAILGIDPPDHFPLLFYRQECADMAFSKEDLNPESFERARALLISGTHLSTSSTYEMTKHAIALAKENSCKVIFDLDYRPVLWGATGHGDGEDRKSASSFVAERMIPLFQSCDLIVGTEEELSVATNKKGASEALQLIRKHSEALVVRKRGEEGAICYPSDYSNPIVGKPYPIEVLNVLGAGDAFLSGFLYGYLSEFSLEECCLLANANGALVVTRHGCSPAMPYLKELELFSQKQINVEQATALHQRVTSGKKEEFSLFAFDHRDHFSGLPPEKVEKFKTLLAKAFLKESPPSCGVIADDDFGKEALKTLEQHQVPIFRCIEKANDPEMRFLDGKEAALILRSWPKEHGVKFLCPLPSEPDLILDRIGALVAATEVTGHELLVEFTCSDSLKVVTDALALCLKRGLTPHWWKLPPLLGPEWSEIEELIASHDPYCRGVLILGQSLPTEELLERFVQIKNSCSLVRGLAVGRSLWADVAEGYFQGELTDDQVVSKVASNLQLLSGHGFGILEKA